jgi:hypothetical protein
MKELKDQEQELLKDLQALLRDAGRGHSTLGWYEYAETYEKLIKEYQDRYDLHSASQSPDGTPGNGRSG